MQAKRVVVTGGSGFIGRAVQNVLRDQGYEPMSWDLADGHDIRTPFTFPEGTWGVIHLAGVLGTHELFDRVQEAIATNIAGTVNVLEACNAAGARYVGITMPPVFPSIYTATKLGAAALEGAYRHNFRLPMAKVRAFNAFGPGQAHGPGHPQKIIPTFATCLWNDEPVPVWGDGLQGVDLIDVTELAGVLVAALHVATADEDVTIDGGTGRSFTVLEVVHMCARLIGVNPTVRFLPMRRGETPTRIVATGEGWDLLSRPPVFREDQLRQAIDSYRPRNVVTEALPAPDAHRLPRRPIAATFMEAPPR